MSKFQKLSILFGLFLSAVSPSEFQNPQLSTKSPERRFKRNSEFLESSSGACKMDVLMKKLSKYMRRNRKDRNMEIFTPLLTQLNATRNAYNNGTEFLKTSKDLVGNVSEEINRLRMRALNASDFIMLNEVERIVYRMISTQQEEQSKRTKYYILMHTEIDFLKCSGIFINPRWVLSTVICCDSLRRRTKIKAYGKILVGNKSYAPDVCYSHADFSEIANKEENSTKNVFLTVADFSLIRINNPVMTWRTFPSIMFNGVNPQTAYSCVAFKNDLQVYVDTLYSCYHLRYMFFKKHDYTLYDICDIIIITRVDGLYSEIFEPGTPLFCDDVMVAVFSRYRTNPAEGYTELLWNKVFNRVFWMQKILEKYNDTLFQRIYPGVKKNVHNISSFLKSAMILIACSVILE